MANVNALLSQRLKKSERVSKMSAMAEKSANGNLTSFAGIFSLSELSSSEKEQLAAILNNHLQEGNEISSDLESLISITSEVKAINNQAALLHGERIKKAQQLLKKYRDGAFTEWLIACYGNRQTPYNLLQYYEFYELLPKPLKSKVETMPRQAVYTLASREGLIESKQKIVENYQGESKLELLNLIRELFPLDSNDRRSSSIADQAISALRRVCALMNRTQKKLTKSQKVILLALIEELNMKVSSL